MLGCALAVHRRRAATAAERSIVDRSRRGHARNALGSLDHAPLHWQRRAVGVTGHVHIGLGQHAPCGRKPSGACSERSMPRSETSEAVTSSAQRVICTPSSRSRSVKRRGRTVTAEPLFMPAWRRSARSAARAAGREECRWPARAAMRSKYTAHRAMTVTWMGNSAKGCQRLRARQQRGGNQGSRNSRRQAETRIASVSS